MASVPDFRLEYPDFAEVTDLVVQYYLDKTLVYCAFDKCPQYEPYMQLALSAHLLVKSQNNPEGAMDDAPSPALAKKVDDVSVSYGFIRSERDTSSSDAWYGSTPFGKEYMMYRNKCFQTGATTAP